MLLWPIVAAAQTEPVPDAYIEGYAAAMLQREFQLTPRTLRVRNGIISIDAADLAGADRERVVTVLQSIRGVVRVDVRDPAAPPAPPLAPARPGTPPTLAPAEVQTGLMPSGVLFKPLIADPRWPHFAVAYQYYFNDKQLRDVAAVSFGETFTVYRERALHGFWELGIQAGVFAVFDADARSFDLVNADYFVGVPLSYRYESLSAILRVFHQSSHLGDEFLLRSRANRVNLSYEAVDVKVSYDFGDIFRLYGGAGYLFDQDPPGLHPWSLQWGAELRSPWPKRPSDWRPIAAVDVQNREENDWHSDVSVRVGVQIEGALAPRNLQLMIEYFRGHSPNGQFYKDKVDYLGLGAHFHF